MKSLVSVIIPFYRGIRWLAEAVESVFAQTYDNYEIIVINDGSPEDLTEFLQTYAERVRYIVTVNSGPAAARNVGIANAKGEYIAFLDADDLWLPNKLEIQIARMQAQDAVWSQTSYRTFIDGHISETDKMVNIDTSLYNGNIYQACFYSCKMATPAVVIKSDLLRNNENLRFNADMRYGEDCVFWLQIAVKHPILAIPDCLTLVRIRGSNAALIVWIQLRARVLEWKYIRQNKDIFPLNKVSLWCKTASRLCAIGYAFVRVIGKLTNSDRVLEFVSSAMYLIPWLMFKLGGKVYFTRKRKGKED